MLENLHWIVYYDGVIAFLSPQIQCQPQPENNNCSGYKNGPIPARRTYHMREVTPLFYTNLCKFPIVHIFFCLAGSRNIGHVFGNTWSMEKALVKWRTTIFDLKFMKDNQRHAPERKPERPRETHDFLPSVEECLRSYVPFKTWALVLYHHIQIYIVYLIQYGRECCKWLDWPNLYLYICEISNFEIHLNDLI